MKKVTPYGLEIMEHKATYQNTFWLFWKLLCFSFFDHQHQKCDMETGISLYSYTEVVTFADISFKTEPVFLMLAFILHYSCVTYA